MGGWCRLFLGITKYDLHFKNMQNAENVMPIKDMSKHAHFPLSSSYYQCNCPLLETILGLLKSCLLCRPKHYKPNTQGPIMSIHMLGNLNHCNPKTVTSKDTHSSLN